MNQKMRVYIVYISFSFNLQTIGFNIFGHLY